MAPKKLSTPMAKNISPVKIVKEDINANKNGEVKEFKTVEDGGVKGKEENGDGSYLEGLFLLINPKDADSSTKSLVQEILSLYTKELPAMKYAANTGKQSSFLEKCVSNGKFCTLLLTLKSAEGIGKVIAAITYQIIPADTQYAEIPLAAVSSKYHLKGIGQLLYMELRRRLLDVGISTILCWGDKETEGFWHKQGFVTIGEIDTKGRAKRLPIKADIRRALCFPGGSTLMVSHLNKNLHGVDGCSVKLCLKSTQKSMLSTGEFYSVYGSGEDGNMSDSTTALFGVQDNLQQQELKAEAAAKDNSLTYERKTKRVWEGSSSSLKSKRVKATQVSTDYESHPDSVSVSDKKQIDSPSKRNDSGLERNTSETKSIYIDAMQTQSSEQNVEESAPEDTLCVHLIRGESQTKEKRVNIMLMDMANETKRIYLTKITCDLGGAVTTDGSVCTHVLTLKARRTLNFCTALCSGAWIVSPLWLKESSKQGRFVDERPFILDDQEYLNKFRVDLKEAVLRARENPHALLKGYSICLTTNVQPPVKTLSAIIQSAGGEVDVGMENMGDKSRTIFVACEEDMEEALLAVKSGIRTFSSDWLMNCIMKQELDLDAPQFAECL